MRSSIEDVFFSGGDVIKHFWAWSDLSSYLLALASFTLVCSLITALLIEVNILKDSSSVTLVYAHFVDFAVECSIKTVHIFAESFCIAL